ncbi:unnamed protein product [Timema podura]|uniref:Uncharacterized protein n=1 Tax=Timema podura TaxID=61482 RepID=A0ABN7PBP3_TIMPD|nr:unnamed protein product [Timema podura]
MPRRQPASRLYQQSGRHMLAKIVPTFADRGVSFGQHNKPSGRTRTGLKTRRLPCGNLTPVYTCPVISTTAPRGDGWIQEEEGEGDRLVLSVLIIKCKLFTDASV